jgi:putative DNA primase/helicase
LLASASEQHPTGLADLHGKRLVACIEANAGRRLNESLVKELTGGDLIRARRNAGRFLAIRADAQTGYGAEFYADGARHRSRDLATLADGAISRHDPRPQTRLGATRQATRRIERHLNWALLGCANWQEHGLDEPAVVSAATRKYRDDQDDLGGWLNACCVRDPDARTTTGELYKSYKAWSEANGEDAVCSSVFGFCSPNETLKASTVPKKYACERDFDSMTDEWQMADGGGQSRLVPNYARTRALNPK